MRSWPVAVVGGRGRGIDRPMEGLLHARMRLSMPSAVMIVAMCTGLVMAGACSPTGPSPEGHDGRWRGTGPGLSLTFVVAGEKVTDIEFTYQRDAGCSISRVFAQLSVPIYPKNDNPVAIQLGLGGPYFEFQSGAIGPATPGTVSVITYFRSNRSAGGSVGYYYLGPTCYDGSVPFEATRE